MKNTICAIHSTPANFFSETKTQQNKLYIAQTLWRMCTDGFEKFYKSLASRTPLTLVIILSLSIR